MPFSFPLVYERGYRLYRTWGRLCSRPPPPKGAAVATLAYNHQEIAARQLKPELLELDGISRESVQAHYRLYEGYVNKRNEIMRRLGDVDLVAANQVFSEFRGLKLELSFAVGGIKNHEVYFEHLGGAGG